MLNWKFNAKMSSFGQPTLVYRTASVLEWYDRHRVYQLYNIWFIRRRSIKHRRFYVQKYPAQFLMHPNVACLVEENKIVVSTQTGQ